MNHPPFPGVKKFDDKLCSMATRVAPFAAAADDDNDDNDDDVPSLRSKTCVSIRAMATSLASCRPVKTKYWFRVLSAAVHTC